LVTPEEIFLRPVARLPPPYEILELDPCVTFKIRVLKWEIGTVIIHPRIPGVPPEKEVVALRLWTERPYKPYPPLYWDVTPRRLVYMLSPILAQPGYQNLIICIHPYGLRPKKWYEVWTEPLKVE